MHTFQQQHGCQTTYSKQGAAVAQHPFPGGLQQGLVGFGALTAVATMLDRPHRSQFHLLSRIRKALRRPAGDGDAVRARVVQLLVLRKTPTFQSVDDVHFPQGAAAVQHGRVQPGDQVIEVLAAVVPLGQLVKKNMLVQVDFVCLAPVRHGAQRKRDDSVKRWLDLGKGQVRAVQIFHKRGTGAGRAFENQQAADMLGAGLGFCNEKSKVK